MLGSHGLQKSLGTMEYPYFFNLIFYLTLCSLMFGRACIQSLLVYLVQNSIIPEIEPESVSSKPSSTL